MEPAKAVVDKPNDDRDDDDRDDPSDHGVNQTKTATEDRLQDASCPSDQIRVVKPGRRKEESRTGSDKCAHISREII